MRDTQSVEFLQWALPRMGMRWAGFRRVRGQVRKRLARRLVELGLPDLDVYKTRLETSPAEWDHLETLCRITVSRFYRDTAVWDFLGDELLDQLTGLVRRRGDTELRCWSAGCASGEEPYTLALVWRSAVGSSATLGLRILATDADERLLVRARLGAYGRSSVRDLPRELRGRLVMEGERYRIDPADGAPITFERRDVRQEPAPETFHLVLCRNLVFTYFDEALQRELLQRIARQIVPGGVLIVGKHETLPERQTDLVALRPQLGVFTKPGS